MHYDIFNGDADGIFALHQYRLKYPLNRVQLITGVKRDIQLLKQLEEVRDCSLAVFDISLDSNRSSLQEILQNNNTVTYFDHHFAGEIPSSPHLTTRINPSAETCTSIIVNDAIGGEFYLWAICGAYGDNLHQWGEQCAKRHHLSEQQTNQLKELGELVNYNGYGVTPGDLHFDPAHLYRAVCRYSNPFDFILDSAELTTLRDGYKEDMAQALKQSPLDIPGENRIYAFPDKPWARRVSGVFSNLKAREKRGSAHAIITTNTDSSLRISVRAPLEHRYGADTLCHSFPTGGGRAAAGGINQLPADQLNRFIDSFVELYSL